MVQCGSGKRFCEGFAAGGKLSWSGVKHAGMIALKYAIQARTRPHTHLL